VAAHHSSLSIGLLALVQLVPILVFSLGGGAVADAVDRRRLLIATQALLAVSSACLAVLAAQPAPPIWALYAVAFVAAGVGAVDQPTRHRRSRAWFLANAFRPRLP